MMTHDEMIAVIAHHKNGGKVQGKGINTTEWIDIADPLWEFAISEYRIKPEPLVLFAAYNFDNRYMDIVGPNEYEVAAMAREKAIMTKIKKFVEVTE